MLYFLCGMQWLNAHNCSRFINTLSQVGLYGFTNHFSVESHYDHYALWEMMVGFDIMLFFHKRRRPRRAMYLPLVPKTWIMDSNLTQNVRRQLSVREVLFWSQMKIKISKIYSGIKGTLVFFSGLNYTWSIMSARKKLTNRGFASIDTLPSSVLPLLH